MSLEAASNDTSRPMTPTPSPGAVCPAIVRLLFGGDGGAEVDVAPRRRRMISASGFLRRMASRNDPAPSANVQIRHVIDALAPAACGARADAADRTRERLPASSPGCRLHLVAPPLAVAPPLPALPPVATAPPLPGTPPPPVVAILPPAPAPPPAPRPVAPPPPVGGHCCLQPPGWPRHCRAAAPPGTLRTGAAPTTRPCGGNSGRPARGVTSVPTSDTGRAAAFLTSPDPDAGSPEEAPAQPKVAPTDAGSRGTIEFTYMAARRRHLSLSKGALGPN